MQNSLKYHVNKSFELADHSVLPHLAPPTRPAHFHSRDELKQYLQKVFIRPSHSILIEFPLGL